MAYSKILRRLREEKTNYKKRGTMLMGKRDFITVNITNENTQVQILKPGMTGDKVIASAHSRYLLDKGWKGSRKSVSAAYLTGYMAGKKALGNGAKDAIMYTGTRRYTQRMAAALKGVIDAGVKVPADPETFPPEERINGEHLTVKNEVSKIKSSIDSEAKQK
ncbi:MAG: 50S ribosomal protein L18 [Nitrosopumilus sp.]|nr:50S ribosomal protein L18 [Nitrosopumilus sp.]MDF2423335.1 50S ribosomal protein L18 [Nitrosopumilus sp.]MDF2425491.1 50S ribosomal protein L18 [Nitrosopumilus sp.]MDF2426711.1 50S ribosomal protein L18 [Nitrosopumilus sp.]MDF2428110.1 50S ribosomal protein L18 [Nitrosopumilus sp.]